MLIKCKLHRPGGTKIHIGEGKDRVDYHFKPRDKNAPDNDPRVDHVCDVTDKAHIGRLLGIAEGYEVDDSVVGTAPKAASSSVEKGEPATTAAARTGAVQGEQPAPNVDIDKMDKKDLLAAVAAKTGKKPNPSTSTAKLKAILAAPAKS